MTTFLRLSLGLLLASVASAQDVDPVVVRAANVAALLMDEPSWPDDLFDRSFLQAVPPPQIRALCVQLHGQLGDVLSVERTGGDSPFQGRFDVICSKNMVLPMRVGVGASAPHAVVELWFDAPAPLLASWTDLAAALAALPGKVSLAAARLGASEPEWIATHGAEEALAIGSAFKLWILGELAGQVAAGARRWSDVITLRPEWMSLPSGRLHEWPAGAPVTLHTLAALMISESDNTATDHLLLTLGREAVEARGAAMGNTHAARNQPMLTTSEMFRIKLARGDAEAPVYLLLPDATRRRAYLEQEVSALPLAGPEVDPGALSSPAHIDTIEWFASAPDLCRTMDALRRQAAADPTVLGVLGITAGLGSATYAFDEVGFKGGSEPGVICLSFLLRKGEQWYALTGTWNDTTAAVDEARFAGLMTRALRILAAED